MFDNISKTMQDTGLVLMDHL